MQSTRSRYLVSNLVRSRGLGRSALIHTRCSLHRQSQHPQPRSFTPHAPRQFSQSSWLGYPRKDSQDKDSISTEATEYSKSGTDDASARQEDASFDPSITDPGKEKEKAGERNSVRPPFYQLLLRRRTDASCLGGSLD